jgi:hypothetical protein
MPPTLFVEGDRKAVISERITVTRVITEKTRNIILNLNKTRVIKERLVWK